MGADDRWQPWGMRAMGAICVRHLPSCSREDLTPTMLLVCGGKWRVDGKALERRSCQAAVLVALGHKRFISILRSTPLQRVRGLLRSSFLTHRYPLAAHYRLHDGYGSPLPSLRGLRFPEAWMMIPPSEAQTPANAARKLHHRRHITSVVAASQHRN